MLEGPENGAIKFVHGAESQGCHENYQSEADLQKTEEAKRARDAIGNAPAERTANRHPSEEARQNSGHRLRRISENQYELARPHDLVDQARSA